MVTNMKHTLINSLEYPRKLLKEYLTMDDCPHSYLYNKHDFNCLDCNSKSECEWLFKNDGVELLNNKSYVQLLSDLEFMLISVQGHIARWEHDSHHCQCEACGWLKNAQDVFDMSKYISVNKYSENTT